MPRIAHPRLRRSTILISTSWCLITALLRIKAMMILPKCVTANSLPQGMRANKVKSIRTNSPTIRERI